MLIENTDEFTASAVCNPLFREELRKLDAYSRTSNYLAIGQIYLRENPLLGAPLELKHIKPRLLGHWGTTTGLNFLYAHLNRLIRQNDLDMIFIAGPGHGGPALIAQKYLEGAYSERYQAIGRNRQGLQRLFQQFSWPYGVPSHVSPETPGSIHEGGELGYSLAHAYSAAFDNLYLIVYCVIGEGENETGALAASWYSNKFLNPPVDGAVLPILHLNGYKIDNPAFLSRIGCEELMDLMHGYGYEPMFVEGDVPATVHRKLAGTLDQALERILQIQSHARKAHAGSTPQRPLWPMIVFRTPKGWTGPKFVDGQPVEGFWRLHQVPISDMSNPVHLQMHRRMGANPHANGGELLLPLTMPPLQNYAVLLEAPGAVKVEATPVLGVMLRDIFKLNADAKNFRLFGPEETTSNRL